MTKSSRLISTILFLTLVLSACNLPPSGTQEENGGGNASAILTAAAQTVEASLTQTAAQNTPTVAVLPTSTVAPPTVTLAAASPTLNVPAATVTQDCDKADFVTDVTIPDDTVLDPGESFTKTWRLKNSGTCSWTCHPGVDRQRQSRPDAGYLRRSESAHHARDLQRRLDAAQCGRGNIQNKLLCGDQGRRGRPICRDQC
jgi:hypothetical protein